METLLGECKPSHSPLMTDLLEKVEFLLLWVDEGMAGSWEGDDL